MRVVLRNPKRELDVPAPRQRRSALLRDLEIVPESVLVIRNDTLATHDERLHDDDVVEIRPVISGGAAMKCGRCRAPAVIEVRRHNAGYCRDCFLRHCGEQVRRAIDHFDMIEPGERVLVAVSGGKDSLGLWQLLRELGYDADGLYLGLGIGEYSDESGRYVRAFARERGWKLLEIDLADDVRVRRPKRLARREARAVLGVRPLEAPHLQRGRDHARLRRARDRSQPRRRSRGAVRQRVALGDRVPRAPASGAPRRARLRAQGEAADPPERARARRVLRAHRHRLHRRGVPDGRGQPPPRLQEHARTRSRNARRAPRPRSCSASSSAAHERFTDEVDDARDDLRPCTSAGRRRPGDVCAFCRMRARAVGAPHRRPEQRREPRCSRPASGCCSSTTGAAATSSCSSTGGQFHTHAGIIDHDDIIGHPDGSTVRTTRGARLTALRPTLAEYVLEMPRGAQVIYPKDIGPILILADIFPGARVLESGVGSGALTSALLRAIGPTGSVTGYEIRDDFAQRALRERARLPRHRRSARRRRSATSTKASTSATSTASCSTSPSRGGS